MLKDRNVVFNSVFCYAICLNENPVHLQKMSRSQTFLDKTGSCWCSEHRNRGELMNWAAEHGFPAITFTGQMRYAIGVEKGKDNEDLWKWAVWLGSDDMIQSAIQSVMGHDEVAS